MLAIARPARRRFPVGLGLGVGAAAVLVAALATARPYRSAPPAVEAPPEPVLVPLSGTAWRDAGLARCLAFLDGWLDRPGWTLRVRRGASGCTSDEAREGFAIDGGGRATWLDRHGRARATTVPDRVVDELRAIAAESCELPADEERPAYVVDWIELTWAGEGAADLRIHASPALRRLDRLIDEVEDGYRAQRLAPRGGLALEATLPADAWPAYHPRRLELTVARDRVVVRDGRRTVLAPIDDDTALLALDWIELDGAVPALLPWELGFAIDQGLER